MAYFAKLDENNKVIEVHAVHNNELLDENGVEQEYKGIEFLVAWSGGYTRWKQTSYNTRGGVHYDSQTMTPSFDQSKAFRKNSAGVGFTYDPNLDAFIPPKPYPSWTLNEATCIWEPPFPCPLSDVYLTWNEEQQNWVPYT